MKPFKYETYNYGDIKICSSLRTSEDDYMIIAHQFLQNLMKEFAFLSEKSFNIEYEAINMPYMYSERRLDSVVLPALSKICDGLVLTELPVQRRKGNNHIKSLHGRLDYWCIYGGYTFAIEMKGTRDRLDCGTIRENSVLKRWGKMIEQLRDVKNECENMQEKTRGIIRLGLHFISSWAPNEPFNEQVDEYRDKLSWNLDAFSEHLSERYDDNPDFNPSFAAAWYIPDKMIYYNKANETYPGVMLYAKIFSPLNHKSHE